MSVYADVVSAGFVWGTIVAVACLLSGVGAIAYSVHARGNQDPYALPWWVGLAAGCAAIVVTVVVWVAASWPLKYDYHHWVDVRGKVQRTSSRFVSAGDSGGTNQRFVFVIDGRAYGVDDTRASLARVGSLVHLRCKKEHQWFQRYSDDGWACRWMNDSQVTS